MKSRTRLVLIFAIVIGFIAVLTVTSMSSMSAQHRMPDGSVMDGGSMNGSSGGSSPSSP